MRQKKIRLITFNTWHGLDHRHPYLMLPLQRPDRTFRRYQRQKEALQSLFKKKIDGLDLCCLQELNPLWPRLKTLKNALKARGKGIIANAGIRAGYLGIPPFLEEGIATLFRGDLKEALWSAHTLSGDAKEIKGPLGIPLFFQFGERRVALKLRGEFEGIRLVVVQAHLHAGPGKGSSCDRRTAEIESLAEWIKPDLKKCDLLLLVGDFNNDPESSSGEIAPLAKLGLERLSTDADREITWCPDENPLCRLPSGGNRSDTEVEWDAQPHHFDRVYCWRDTGPASVIDGATWECKIQRVLDNPEDALSDHFGILAEISFNTLKVET
jgi:endonuclease/exonuclease/phosphatase family metal-dependent hydrolase